MNLVAQLVGENDRKGREGRGGENDRKGREGTSRLVYTSLGVHYAVV
jgi:hypothetical protein